MKHACSNTFKDTLPFPPCMDMVTWIISSTCRWNSWARVSLSNKRRVRGWQSRRPSALSIKQYVQPELDVIQSLTNRVYSSQRCSTFTLSVLSIVTSSPRTSFALWTIHRRSNSSTLAFPNPIPVIRRVGASMIHSRIIEISSDRFIGRV